MTDGHDQAVDISETVGVETGPDCASEGIVEEGGIPGMQEDLANEGTENDLIDRWTAEVRRKREDAMGKRAVLAKL